MYLELLVKYLAGNLKAVILKPLLLHFNFYFLLFLSIIIIIDNLTTITNNKHIKYNNNTNNMPAMNSDEEIYSPISDRSISPNKYNSSNTTINGHSNKRPHTARTSNTNNGNTNI